MASASDSYDNQGGSGFMMGLLTGTAVGVGLGMLFAPRTGSELRSRLADQAGTLANQAQDRYRKATRNAGEWVENSKETAADWTERAKDTYDKTREAVTQGAEEAQDYLRDSMPSNLRSTTSGSANHDPSAPSGSKRTRAAGTSSSDQLTDSGDPSSSTVGGGSRRS